MIARILVVLGLLAACGADPAPVEITDGHVTARIESVPARITLLVDGNVVWQTAAGAFAGVSALNVTTEMQFGSFKFTEAQTDKWRTIDHLRGVTANGMTATFDLAAGDSRIGSGSITLGDHVAIQLATDHGDQIEIGTALVDGEHTVGLGGQSFSVDHRGETVPLWVQEDGIGKDDFADNDYGGVWFLSGRRHSTHTPMPMLLSSRNYAMLMDTDARATFELGAVNSDVAHLSVWQPSLSLQIFLGASARDALGQMIAWVGKPDSPPRTIYAPWVDAIFGSASVRQVASALRTNGVSSSVIWTEDWRGGGDGATGYALLENWRVDRTLYPDFEQLASDLHGEGFAFLVYHNTFIDSTADISAEANAAGYPIHDGSGGNYTFTGVKFNPATMLDLSSDAAVTWAKSVMGEALTLGADGWMADFAEWLPTDAVLASGEDAYVAHNAYAREWAKYNHDLLGPHHGLYFMRSAWLHSQPFAQVMWLGDQQTDWSVGDGFPSVVPIGLGLGLTGFPYIGSDIGGYMSQGTVPTTEELFYRWTTLGALSPVMRTHHGRSARMNFQWQHDAQSIAHFRRWTRFHMQLAAYLEGMQKSFERDGLPLFRMIALDFPADDFAWTTVDEYLLGDRILVAPVLTQGATDRMVTLPTGNWLPLLGGAVATGTVDAPAPTTEIPAFVPEGSLLVLYPDGVDSVLAAPALPSATTTGDDREVWLYAGTATDAARAAWNDTAGTTDAPQWTWAGRALGAAPPASATFNGQPVTVTAQAGYATLQVTGDGTLALDGGGTLTIARGLPNAHVTVRVY